MIAVIVNPIAGGARPEAARKRVELATRIMEGAREGAEVLVSERRGHARELARRSVESGARLVIAWGGDGTVNEVASQLVGQNATLGIVPAGSGNGLSRELKVANEPEKAIADAVAARPRAIDAGELAGRLFFSVAGVGFDAHVAACFDTHLAGRRGFAGYARITARELIRYTARKYRVGTTALDRVLLITLANSGQWGNGARIAPSARLDDGQLDLVVFEERSRFSTICGLRRVFSGTIASQAGVSIRRVQEVVIESDEPMTFHVDGEVVQGGTRLEGRVLPGVLRVAVR